MAEQVEGLGESPLPVGGLSPPYQSKTVIFWVRFWTTAPNQRCITPFSTPQKFGVATGSCMPFKTPWGLTKNFFFRSFTLIFHRQLRLG